MNGAERLREAARVLRERAEAAGGWSWRVVADPIVKDRTGISAQTPSWATDVPNIGYVHATPDAAYIATVDPVFGLAVANALDMAANYSYAQGDWYTRMLAVADAVLGDGEGR